MVITFSTHFQKGHPREGERTSFLEKIWSGLLTIDNDLYSDYLHPDGRPDSIKHADYYRSFSPKYHTVRAGQRFKVGDSFDPRIWTGKPYASKQFQFAPRLTVKKIWNFSICPFTGDYLLFEEPLKLHQVKEIALNDGLEVDDFECWFPKSFSGQIICWNEKLQYS